MTDIKHAHERIDRIESTVNGHGEMLKALSINQQEQSAALHENTVLTKTIADNTDELVSLIKGSKVLYKIMLVIAGLGGMAYAFIKWVILNGFKF